MRAFVAEKHLTMPTAIDESGELLRRFGVTSVPTVIVTDAHGRIVQRVEGRDASVRKSPPRWRTEATCRTRRASDCR